MAGCIVWTLLIVLGIGIGLYQAGDGYKDHEDFSTHYGYENEDYYDESW